MNATRALSISRAGFAAVLVLAISHSTFATPINVSIFRDIVPFESGFTSSFTVSSANGPLTYLGQPTDLKVFLFAYKLYEGTPQIVGVLDNYAIRSKYPNGYGAIRQEIGGYYGLTSGEQPAFFAAAVDLNGDGDVGTWDAATHSLIVDPGDYFPAAHVTVTVVPTLRPNLPYEIRGVSIVPEPSTCCMALVGLACGGYSMFRRHKRA